MINNLRTNKTALITGAASGLGFEFSKLLAKDEYDLILIDIDQKKLVKTKSHIQKEHNIEIEILKKDLCKKDVAQEIFDLVKGKTIDVLVNNAGFGLFGAFSETSWSREFEMLNLHILTTTQMTKLFLTGMVEQNSGRVLNVSSLAAFEPGPLMSIYYASKAYILSFSEAIANELKGTGVTVTTLCPGPTNTGFQEVVSNHSSKNKIKFNMASAKKVAETGYKAMLAGKVLSIPGLLNKIIAFLPRIIPRKTVTSIVRKVQEKNRSESPKYAHI